MSDELDDLLRELQVDTSESIDEFEVPKEGEKAPQIQASVVIPETTGNAVGVDVVKYHEKLDEVTDDILKACKSDRAELQSVIDMMFDEINAARDENRLPSRGYTDNLTKLLEVKSNVNMVAVKIMEANSKMLAATKAASMTINNNNMAMLPADDYLKRILDEPMSEDDNI